MYHVREQSHMASVRLDDICIESIMCFPNKLAPALPSPKPFPLLRVEAGVHAQI
jgi:hypothetical protein